MSSENLFQPVNLKLEKTQKLFWRIGFFGSLVYGIIVTLIFFFSGLPEATLTTMIFSYMFIAPAILYFVWFMGGYWKLKKVPQNRGLLGSNLTMVILFLLMGIFVVTWAAYWNSGIDTFWFLAANSYYEATGDDIGTLVLYEVGSIGVTPAFVEEFLKSFPSVIAAFVVLNRTSNSQQKRRGMLGNELSGMLFGLMIGITFEILELTIYVLGAIYGGGTLLDVYIQVTVRNWAPIHILGGAVGGYAAGRAERLRFENGEEDLPAGLQLKKFIRRFVPLWLIPVAMHFTWNSSGVWIWLGFYYAQNNDIVLYTAIQFIVLVILSILCFLILVKLYKNAQKACARTYRCLETGLYIIAPEVICNPITDNSEQQQMPLSPPAPPAPTVPSSQSEFRYCYNCGTQIPRIHRFCTNCGADMGYLDYVRETQHMQEMQRYFWKPRMYSGFVRWFLILTIIFSILFILGNLFLVWVSISVLGSNYIGPLLFQFFIEITSAFLLIISAISLIQMEKYFSGKKNVWFWIIYLFNYIGLLFALIFMGCYFLILDIMTSLEAGESTTLIADLGIAMIFIGAIMLVLLIFFYKKGGGQLALHYQKLAL